MTKILSEDRFKVLFDNSSDPHFIFIEKGIVDCNEATIKILGCSSKEEVLAIHPVKLSPQYQPDGRLSTEKSLEMDRIARTNGHHRFDWVHQKMNGENFPVEVVLNAVTIEGKPAMIAVWHDLTERKKHEERLRRVSEDLQSVNTQLTKANRRMKSDLESAAAIQKSLLPNKSPFIRGLKTAWKFRPCDELGGDILNVFLLDNKKAGLYVLDVTGHGVAASLLSVAASHFLSPFSEAYFLKDASQKDKFGSDVLGPAEVARRLNNQFGSQPEAPQYFTMLYGVLDLESYEFSYVAAGHPSPVFVPKDNRAAMLGGSGFPIGVLSDSQYTEESLLLNPGDRLYLYSDGVTEAKSPSGEFFGEERFMALLDAQKNISLQDSIEQTLLRLEHWCGQLGPNDDISLLAFEIV